MFALALALAVTAPAEPVAPRGPNEETLIHFLWYESPITLGAMSCDKSQSRAQEAEFGRRFKRRIKRLRAAYETVNGADESIDVIAIGRCTRSDDPDVIDAAFEKGMKAFDAKLRVFEARYGLSR